MTPANPVKPTGSALLRERGNAIYLIPIRDAVAVLIPSGSRRIPEEIRTGDVVNSVLGASDTGTLFLSQVSARAIEAVCLLMAVSLDLETLMQSIP